MNGEGKCVVARAHPENDSATDAGKNRCPQGVPKMSQIRSGNVLCNANHLTVFEVDAIVFLRLPLAYLLRKSDKPEPGGRPRLIIHECTR